MYSRDSLPNGPGRKIFLEFEEKFHKGMPIKNPEILLEYLSERERVFVREYMKSLDATKAGAVAYPNTKHPAQAGWNLANSRKITLVVDLLKHEAAKKSNISKDTIVQRVLKIVNDCEKQETYNPNAALRGLELLAKISGMFVEKHEISGKDGDAIKYEKVEEDARDFTRAIAGLAERAGTTGIPLKVVGG